MWKFKFWWERHSNRYVRIILATEYTAINQMSKPKQQNCSSWFILWQRHVGQKLWKWKSSSHVWLFATPWTVAHQILLSMEFSRQEYWSGLVFPSPGDLSNPGIEPRSPAFQSDSLLSEPLRKPKNTGVGSLSFLQESFLTQTTDLGLLHCGLILYQLSFQGSPRLHQWNINLNFLKQMDTDEDSQAAVENL